MCVSFQSAASVSHSVLRNFPVSAAVSCDNIPKYNKHPRVGGGGGLYAYSVASSCRADPVTRAPVRLQIFPSDTCVLYAAHTPLTSNERRTHIIYV